MARRSEASLGAPPKGVFEAARQFKLRFGCTELSPVPPSVGHVSWPQRVFIARCGRGLPGAGVPHFARVLAHRASLENPRRHAVHVGRSGPRNVALRTREMEVFFGGEESENGGEMFFKQK